MPASPPVYEGTVLAGKYRVERVLGSGGMGVVVAAQHIALGDKVAIKFLLPQAASNPEVVGRFLREGRAAARVRSEHVARVFDVGTLDDGAPYLVMEYLEGTDLGALLRSHGPLPVPVAVDYVLQVCEALAEAHAAGIVHRDLKPSNLFLTRRSDGTAGIKLIDFGISKLSGHAEGDVGGTASAIMMGSPLFMAPEQMKSARDVDARADVWSLGGILFMLMTARPPFEGETVMAIYELILMGPPRAGALVPGVPPELDAVVAGCLQRDASIRFQDVGQVAATIAPFGPPGSIDRAARVHRILHAGQAPTMPLSTAPPAASTQPLPAMSGQVSPSTPVPARSGASASNAGRELGSDGPWNSTHGPTKNRSRGLAVGLSIGGLVVLAAIALGWMTLARRDGGSASPDPSQVASTVPSAPINTTPVAASALPVGSAIPSSEPVASAEPATSASQAPSAVPRGNGPRPRPRPEGKPPRDLFGDPR